MAHIQYKIPGTALYNDPVFNNIIRSIHVVLRERGTGNLVHIHPERSFPTNLV